MVNPYRSLPSIDRLLGDGRVRALTSVYGQGLLTRVLRRELDLARQAISAGAEAPTVDDLAGSVARRLDALAGGSPRPVINASGVIIHTNLGRAPLSEEAIAAMARVSMGYSNLEFDLEVGERGSRNEHLEGLLCDLTGAEAALVVNNNAGAVLLALRALAQDREVIVSRGQSVEIGGGFRIPDVMLQSGARLTEVGTTNRTYRWDYEEAVTENTAALLRVHSSNFRLIGFVESVSLEDMVRLARERGLIIMDDLGSGCLLDTANYGLAHEPAIQESIAAGADLVFASGDKLLGGPQAGIIAGRSDLIGQLRRHPLARALRLDKANIAGLSATLLHYLRGEAEVKVPVWRMIAMQPQMIRRRARRWAGIVGSAGRVVAGRSVVGGGSLPEESLPTYLLSIPQTPDLQVVELAGRLRRHRPPVVGRIERDALLLDPRTVSPADDRIVMNALKDALAEPFSDSSGSQGG